MSENPQSRLKLGQNLIAAGVLSADQLRIALQEQRASKEPIGHLLVSLGFVRENVLSQALSESFGQASIDLDSITPDAEALARVPCELAKRHRALPLAYIPATRNLLLAVADCHDLLALDRIQAQLEPGCSIETRIAGESEISRAIDRFYGHELSIDGILNELESGGMVQQKWGPAMPDYSHPIVRLIDALLGDAVKNLASDIHFEPEAHFLRIRYRIDGMLRQIRVLHKSYWPAMAVRLKVMAGMNIAEVRAPQDGHISLTIGGRNIDFRAACLPTTHGENIVLRILDCERGIVPLPQLGLEPEHLHSLRAMTSRPEGIILVTGPTGSGKTTMLYSLLADINHEGINIMTLEDPVEYRLPQVRQSSLNENSKLDFASGIRAMMRQDPDVILVGEIRDAETAEMAFRAAMTGHQVFSTLHSNSALGAIPRLIDIGIRPGIMAGNIIGIVAQRLIRRLCQKCRRAHPPDSDEIRLLATCSDETPTQLHSPGGCEECAFRGYRGRLALLEILPIDPAMDELIGAGADLGSIRQLAVSHGFRTLTDDGLRHVFDGTTSLAELDRVVGLSARL